MATLDEPPSHPPPPPPKRLSRPKITLQIPDTPSVLAPRGATTGNSIYWGPSRYQGRPPGTPASQISGPHGDPYFNPFLYQNKASDFMFKQFAGFKDFTMHTAKSGLSAGEKSAFWFYNKLSVLSKRWFTHIFLCLCLVLYSLIGAGIFMALEGSHEEDGVKVVKNLTEVRKEFREELQNLLRRHEYVHQNSDLFNEDIAIALKNLNKTDPNISHKKMWSFWNSMFYAGTIYTTIGRSTK